jgi:hypothetical protein
MAADDRLVPVIRASTVLWAGGSTAALLAMSVNLNWRAEWLETAGDKWRYRLRGRWTLGLLLGLQFLQCTRWIACRTVVGRAVLEAGGGSRPCAIRRLCNPSHEPLRTASSHLLGVFCAKVSSASKQHVIRRDEDIAYLSWSPRVMRLVVVRKIYNATQCHGSG